MLRLAAIVLAVASSSIACATEMPKGDVLLIATGIFLLLAMVGIGVFYFKLHALPEQLAHRGQKVQFQFVSVLALLALFTHNHAFWIAGLLLAFIPLPDVKTPVWAIVDSLHRIAANSGPPAPTPPPAPQEATPAGDHSQGHPGA